MLICVLHVFVICVLGLVVTAEEGGSMLPKRNALFSVFL
jgi:hypothetical protein